MGGSDTSGGAVQVGDLVRYAMTDEIYLALVIDINRIQAQIRWLNHPRVDDLVTWVNRRALEVIA